MFDILIRNGVVIDGSGAPRRRADVAISGGRVQAVEPGLAKKAGVLIDASNLIVAPGFVDMHSHADRTLPILPTADSLAHQGIATVVIGQCGSSPAPLSERTREIVLAAQRSDDLPLPWERWSSFASYLDTLREVGTSINAVPLVGQSTVRQAVMAFSAAEPTAEQVAEMQEWVRRAMDEGAVGISTGLIYPPGSYASTEEIIALTKPVGERGGYYFSHIRGEADTLLDAVAEAIRIGRETGASVEIAHFKAAGRQNWGKAEQALALIDDARAQGLDISADMYPYLAGSSSLKSMLPEWAQEGGKEATLARLADIEIRRRMSRDMERIGFFRGSEWDKVLIATSPRNRAYEGYTVAELAEAAGKSPHEWVFDALQETELQISMISHYATEENLIRQLRVPWMMIGTDAGGAATHGPLSQGKPHPRNYGTFPRVLGRFVREMGILSLEEAVRKMSGLPAQKLRWRDRGLLRPGYWADIVIFDPDTVSDQATYRDPHQYAVGIHHLLVNGCLVIRDGQHTGARPGQVLAREG
ncbi:MAG: D-aminoacylase [Chloroflexi bacterium]|nr:D-aminoacylase [Chloroflexota bacterium]